MTQHLRDIYAPSVTIAAMRVIRCDCGFEATGDGEEELVSRAQAHARGVHGVDVSAELVRGLAESKAPPEDG